MILSIKESIDIHRAQFMIGVFLLLIGPSFYGIINHRITMACTLVGSAILILEVCRINGGKLFSSGVYIAWIILACIAVMSHIASIGFSALWSVGCLLLFVFVFSLLSSEVDWIKPALIVLLALLSIHMIATILFYIFPDLYQLYVKPALLMDAREAHDYRSSLTTNYSVNGQYLAYGLVLAGCFMIYERKLRKVFFAVLFSLFFFALLLTTKRAQFLFGLAALLLCYLVSGRKNRFTIAIAVVLILILAVAVLLPYVPGVEMAISRFAGTVEADGLDEISSGRTYLWSAAISGWQRNPWTGNGWGTFVYFWPSGTHSVLAHNEALHLLYEVGIFGAAAFITVELISITMAINVVRALNKKQSAPTMSKIAGLFAFGCQFFTLIYGYSTGTILQLAYVYTPYILAVGISVAYQAGLQRGAM